MIDWNDVLDGSAALVMLLVFCFALAFLLAAFETLADMEYRNERGSREE